MRLAGNRCRALYNVPCNAPVCIAKPLHNGNGQGRRFAFSERNSHLKRTGQCFVHSCRCFSQRCEQHSGILMIPKVLKIQTQNLGESIVCIYFIHVKGNPSYVWVSSMCRCHSDVYIYHSVQNVFALYVVMNRMTHFACEIGDMGSSFFHMRPMYDPSFTGVML